MWDRMTSRRLSFVMCNTWSWHAFVKTSMCATLGARLKAGVGPRYAWRVNKFPGARQNDTLVAVMNTLIQIMWDCPGTTARAFKRQCAKRRKQHAVDSIGGPVSTTQTRRASDGLKFGLTLWKLLSRRQQFGNKNNARPTSLENCVDATSRATTLMKTSVREKAYALVHERQIAADRT